MALKNLPFGSARAAFARHRLAPALCCNLYRKDMSINLHNYSFDEWVKFVFDHPVSEPAWYWDDAWNWEGDPNVLLEYATGLFSSPEFLLQEYSSEQLEQGFWFLLGPAGKLDRWVWAKEIDWSVRKDCISSMVNVFEQLFVKNPLSEPVTCGGICCVSLGMKVILR